MRRLLLLLFLFVAACPGIVQSQTAVKVYSGRVVSPEGKAIEYATVVLLQSGCQKAGAITDSIGNFSLEAKTGNYTLIIQCMGYEPVRKEISLPVVSAENITLSPSAYALKEVTVQARNIERKSDRFILSVSPTTGKDGTELLSQAPGVWLSADNISINGSSGTKIFVDNREIKLDGEELLAYLRSLKSGDIKQIEVIPTAGAEYDADSHGGIINISLRQRLRNGLQGNIMIGTVSGSSFSRYLPSGTVNARIGKWMINAAASGTFTPTDKSTLASVREYTDKTIGFTSHSRFDILSKHGTGRIGTIFEIDTLNSIGAEIEYISQVARGGSNSRTALSKEDMLTDSYGDYYQRNKYKTIAATANYLHKFDNNGSILKLIVDYANKKSTGKNNYRVVQKTTGWQNDSTYRSQADATYDIVTTDLSLVKKIKKAMSVNAGLKYTHTRMSDHSSYEGLSENDRWTINPGYGYALRYNENIMGAYAVFSMDIDRWSFKAGIRGESTRTSNRSDGIDRNYFDLFPNLNITYAFDRLKTQMLVGQYSRNIERPAFYALSPNHIQFSDYNYQIGNPYLKPTYINRFNLTYVYNYRYTVTIGGNLHHNLIREFSKIDVNNPDVSYITFENHARENHWFVAINLPYQPVSWYNLSVNFVGVKQDIKMTETAGFAKHYLMFANAVSTFYLPADYSLEAQYSGASRLYSGNSEVAPRHTLDLTVRKKFMNDKLIVSAGINNIFNRFNGYANTLETYSTQSQYKESHAGRVFKISLSWNFNSGKKVAKSKIERSPENELNRLNEK